MFVEPLIMSKGPIPHDPVTLICPTCKNGFAVPYPARKYRIYCSRTCNASVLGRLKFPDQKPCKKCDRILPRSEFYPQKNSPNALRSICKYCHKKDSLIRGNRYRAEKPDYFRRKVAAQKHGITLSELDALFESVDHRCEICGVEVLADGRRLSIDHCHKTSRIRGILCNLCNRGLGMFGDSPDLLTKALAYLARPLGKETRHYVDKRRIAMGRQLGTNSG